MRPICSKAEVQVLEKYGAWMEALHREKITPITNRQKQFCRHIKSDTPPEEFYALLFWKYLKRKEIDQYEAEALAFRLDAMLKEARKEAKLTQEELAKRTGTKKSYISRIERGQSDIQVSTYHKLIEIGLEKSLTISIG